MFEWIPIEMHAMSVLSAILFSFGGLVGWYMHSRLAALEETVSDRSLDIKKLSEMCENTEKAIASIKVDNRLMIGWVRNDNKENWNRIEESLAEIRNRLYGSN